MKNYFTLNRDPLFMRPTFRHLVPFVYHHYVAILIAAICLSILAGNAALQLRLETDFIHLLPDSEVSVHELNRIKEKVGGIGPLSIVITGDDLKRVVEFMEVLADSLEHDPLIGAVVRGKSADFFSRNRLLYMDLKDLETIHARLDEYIDLQKLKQSPLYLPLGDEEEQLDFADIREKYSRYAGGDLERNYYLTGEGNGVVLQVYPTGVITDVEFSRQLLADLDARIAAIGPERFDPDIRYTCEGSFKNTLYQYNVILRDLKSTAVYSVAGVLLLIVLYFRHLLAAAFVSLPLVISLTWTFGLTELAIGRDRVKLINVHLYSKKHGYEKKREQVENLLALVESSPYPLIVGGDFNASFARLASNKPASKDPTLPMLIQSGLVSTEGFFDRKTLDYLLLRPGDPTWYLSMAKLPTNTTDHSIIVSEIGVGSSGEKPASWDTSLSFLPLLAIAGGPGEGIGP